jgi:hypothetical protein
MSFVTVACFTQSTAFAAAQEASHALETDGLANSATCDAVSNAPVRRAENV